MTEPTSAALAAAAVITTGTLTLAGNVYGIPADAMLGSILGAGIAMSGAERLDSTFSSVMNAMGAFATSLVLAVFLGPLVGSATDQLLNKLAGVDLPDGPIRAAAALLVAIGLQRRLPALLDRLVARKKDDA